MKFCEKFMNKIEKLTCNFQAVVLRYFLTILIYKGMRKQCQQQRKLQ